MMVGWFCRSQQGPMLACSLLLVVSQFLRFEGSVRFAAILTAALLQLRLLLCGYHGWDPESWGFSLDGAVFHSGIFASKAGRRYPVLIRLPGAPTAAVVLPTQDSACFAARLEPVF